MGTLAFLTQLLLLGLGIFLMIVILLQRGRGGGLAGAFGGLGGQSAFGTKAGDVFTRITIGLAVAWVLVAGGSGYFLRAVAKGTRAQDLGEVSAPQDETAQDEAGDSNGEAQSPAEDSAGASNASGAGGTGAGSATAPQTDASSDAETPAVPSADAPDETE